MAKNFGRNIEPTQRVKDILRLVDKTPLPAHLILDGSTTFGSAEEPDAGFTNVRRVREKMQHLVAARLVTERPYTIAGSGVMKFYQITPAGYELLYQTKPNDSHRKFFRETAKLNWEHSYLNAQVIVKTIVAAHDAHVPRVTHFCRERELRLVAGNYVLEPDHFFQLSSSGQTFNHLFEIDRNTETLDSVHAKSWRHRILGYEAYQDWLLASGKESARRVRVIFLTTSMQHAYNFLVLARDLGRNPDRVLFLAGTFDQYLNDADPLSSPILLDHHGQFQSLVNLHPSSAFNRTPVRLPRQFLAATVPI